jgi:hypothetical protein
VRNARLSGDEIANVPGLQLLYDQPVIAIKVDTIIVSFLVAIEDQTSLYRYVYLSEFFQLDREACPLRWKLRRKGEGIERQRLDWRSIHRDLTPGTNEPAIRFRKMALQLFNITIVEGSAKM